MRARLILGIVAVTTLVTGASPRAQSKAAGDPSVVLDRIVRHLAGYYARAQSLVGQEEVTQQPIRSDFSFEGPAMRYAYQLRLEWTPPENDDIPTATMMRELLTVNGRPPKPKDKPKCMRPTETWPEPLAMFLPTNRDELNFKLAGSGRMDGVETISLDFEERGKPAEPRAQWKKAEGAEDFCVSYELPGRMRGRVWVDRQTGEVLRLDQNLWGPVDIKVPRDMQKHWRSTALTFDRESISIRYKRVTFDDPPEAMMLPESIQTVSMVRGGAQPMRITQRFTKYRRFLTGGRLLE